MRNLESMPVVGLDELVDRAALLNRFDRKYLLPVGDLPVLLDALSPRVRVLEVEGSRCMAYRSEYFDSPGLDCYLAAARRRRRRFKLRIRTYVATGQRFLEVKTRGRRGLTHKQRTPLYHNALSHDFSGFGHDFSGFAHVLTVDYHRTTFFAPADGGRITIDTGLTWRLPGGAWVRTPQLAVVETKSPAAGQDADRLLRALKHRPCSMSKYGTGLAALRPGLPANHWQPVLRRHFPPTHPQR